MTDRQFEIVLYGASGFTGKLVAEYLASDHQDLRWAIAGRNTQKLEQVRRELNLPELPIIIADSADPDSLSTMAKQTRTLISTVGPYAQYGTPVLKACATEGTHYCDLTGEAQWMAEVYEQINPIAQNSGADWSTAVASTPSPRTCRYFSCRSISRSALAAPPTM